MSDENTTGRGVGPEGSVPEDREPEAVTPSEPEAVTVSEPEAVTVSEPETVTATEPTSEPTSESASEPTIDADLAPADERTEAAPGLDLEPDRGADGDEARDQGRGAEDTLLIEQRHPTTELPTAAPVAIASMAPAYPQATTTPAPAPAPQPGGLVTVRTGPRPGAIMLGLICLLVSAYTLARQTTDWRFDFSLAGPISIGALGALLLLVGLVGLLTRRKP